MGVVELGRIPAGLGIKGPMPGLEPGAGGGGSGPGPELPRVWTTAPGSLSAARVRANAGTSKPLVARWAPGLPPCDGGSPSGSHEMRRAHSLAAVDIPRLTPRVQARVSPCSSAAPRPRRPLPKWHHVPGLARLRLDNMRYAAKGACASQLDANANTSARPCPASVPPRIGVQCAWKPASTCGIAADGRRTTGTRWGHREPRSRRYNYCHGPRAWLFGSPLRSPPHPTSVASAVTRSSSRLAIVTLLPPPYPIHSLHPSPCV